MPAKDKLKHWVVFSVAIAMTSVIPLLVIHALTNRTNAQLIKNDALSSLLIISPMLCVGLGIALAMLWLAKHPELL